MGKSLAAQRREALLEAIDWLEYRAAVCLKTEREWAEKYGETHRGTATERSARMELELAIREIARMGNTSPRSKKYRAEMAERDEECGAHGPVHAFPSPSPTAARSDPDA